MPTSDDSEHNEKLGKDRFGSQSISENIGFTSLLIAGLFLIILFIILCIYCICRKTQCSHKCNEILGKLKQKLLYNPFIKYSYLNGLKSNMAALLVIQDFNASPIESRIIAVLIFIIINMLPFLFTKILISNYSRLDKAEILTKYGSIYSSRRVSPGFVRDHLTFIDPLFFFARRTAFVFVCLYKLEDPYR